MLGILIDCVALILYSCVIVVPIVPRRMDVYFAGEQGPQFWYIGTPSEKTQKILNFRYPSTLKMVAYAIAAFIVPSGLAVVFEHGAFDALAIGGFFLWLIIRDMYIRADKRKHDLLIGDPAIVMAKRASFWVLRLDLADSTAHTIYKERINTYFTLTRHLDELLEAPCIDPSVRQTAMLRITALARPIVKLMGYEELFDKAASERQRLAFNEQRQSERTALLIKEELNWLEQF